MKNKQGFAKRYGIFMGFLVLAIILVLPLLTFVETYLHEHAHQKAMNAEGINNHIEYHLENLFTLNFHGSTVGKAVFDTPDDQERFWALPKDRQYPILIAGVLSDLRLAMMIAIVALVLAATPYFLDSPGFNKWYQRKGKLYLAGTLIILMIWLVNIMYSTTYNMTLSGADIPLAVFG